MIFAHLADSHIGGWKEEKLRFLNMECFREAVKIILEKRVDFVLIAGDLFNTALPQIDYIKEVTAEIKKFKDANVPVYYIAGSHDYSPSGKTMLDVLEKAGLMINVMRFENGQLKFTRDSKTGAKIVGMHGKKGGLELVDYETLDFKHLEPEEGFKIFMFHTAVNEFNPKGLEDMPGTSLATLPKYFNYYAGGHVHYVFQKEMEKGVLTFPGALFPNNFKEMEEWKNGGVYFCDENVNWEYVPVKLKDVQTFKIDVSGLSPDRAKDKILDEVRNVSIVDKIVTLRVVGEVDGKSSEVDFQEVYKELKDAYIVLKNTAKLKSNVSKTISVKEGTVEEIEEEIIKEVSKEVKIKELEPEKEESFMKSLMSVLDNEKGEGEKVVDFEKRVVSEAAVVLEIED